VAHEIGNPLNALHIHLQLMERELKKFATVVREGVPQTAGRRKLKADSALPDALAIGHKLEKYLSVSKGEISRLDYIVTQFLEAIRPSAPHIRLASLNDVVKETLELLRPEIENRGITVKEKLARQLSASPLDPAQIKQALVNLIKNALQAMSK